MQGCIRLLNILFLLGLPASPFITPSFAANQQEISRSELLKFRPKLGPLTARQNSLFQDEVLNEPERYVKGIKKSEGNIVVQVDETAIRQVLAFDAVDLGFKTAPVIGFAARVRTGCTVCEREANSLHAHFQSRLERRGFQVKRLIAVEFGEGSNDPFTQIALQQQLQGILVIDLAQEIKDQEQVITGKVHLRFLKPNLSTYFTGDEDFEIAVNDTLVTLVDQWLTRSWMRLGELSSMTQSAMATNSNRMNIEVLGCSSLKQFHWVRTKLQETLTSATTVAEYTFEPGKITFWVKGYPASSIITEALRSGLKAESSVRQIQTTNSNTVTMSLKGDES